MYYKKVKLPVCTPGRYIGAAVQLHSFLTLEVGGQWPASPQKEPLVTNEQVSIMQSFGCTARNKYKNR